MTGRDFVVELERHGFVVRRRSSTFLWVGRGEQTLMLDVEATVPETYLARILATRSRPPMSTRLPSGRPSMRPSGRPSGRPSNYPSQRP